MRVVYLDPDFETLTGETGPRSYAFARRLLACGHEVTVLTSDRQLGAAMPAADGRLCRLVVHGVPVCAIRAGLGAGRGLIHRLWHHLIFAVLCAWYLLRCERPDVVYVTSPPLSVVPPVLLGRWLRGVPFVLEVRELWPEVPAGLDVIRSRLLIRLLRRLARLGYRYASRIVALTRPAAGHIAADVPLTDKVVVIPPCCDINLFDWGDGTAIRERQGWNDRFVCVHVGPMIRATGLEAVLRLADVLREDEQFVFWLVGGGDQRGELERNIRDRELPNVVIWDRQPRDRLADVLAAADLCLLTVRHLRVLEQSSGERLFDYLAAGKPVLMNYSGWQRELLESHGAGIGTPLGNHGELFERICQLCDDSKRRNEMGWNARRLAETEYHPDVWYERFEEVLHQAAGPQRVASDESRVTSDD